MTERPSKQWLDSRGWKERWESGGYIPADTQVLLTEIEQLRAALRHLDAMIFEDKQIIERAGEMRAFIWNTLPKSVTD